ncbi:MAG TPA: 3-keto-5-aminohexanoate cleavage protein [Candidatus Limnocylindria bacterium]|nr:3-keto-5-aminohexanoate cleavage protein [Candidatus Limnocylindria bacterium]
MEGPLILEACLNGDRLRAEHPDVPISADELAREAQAVVAAGADAIHVHPREPGGRQTMGPRQCSAAIAAIRAAAPHTPVGVTTIASIEPDPARRVALLRRWTEKPDFVSVNWSEEGAAALVIACVERDIGIEAGIWTEDDARRFVESDLAKFCLRALVEPLSQSTAEALGTAERIVALLAPTGLPLVVHGHDRTTWAVLRWAVAHGHGIRIGLEDTLTLEGGLPVRGNAELVAAAARLAGR